MQGVVARRNNFVEPILDFFEDAYRGFRRADRPRLRSGQPVQDRGCRHRVRVAGIGRREHRSGGRLPARAAGREGRLDPPERVPAVPGSGHRQGAGREEERHHPRAHRRAAGGRQPDGPRHPHGAEQGAAARRRAPGDHGRPDAAAVRRGLRPGLARLPARAHARRLRVRHRQARAQGRQARGGWRRPSSCWASITPTR